MNILSLFANIGVAEAYLESIGYNVVLANELIPRRAALYSAIYPNSEMICGDITDKDVFHTILEKAREKGIDIIMATPPCQGISRAGRQLVGDIRNMLVLPVLEMIQLIKPKYALIENVPQFVETSIQVDGKYQLITDLIGERLKADYSISINIVDTKYYSVPQTRQRTIILLTRKDQLSVWELPSPSDKLISLEDAIGNLPSVDPIVSDVSAEEYSKMFPDHLQKQMAASLVSKWHKPPVHIKRQVITMIHTPTGKTAFDNPVYKPRKADGSLVTGYKSTYRRLRWCDPASTVTMDNRKISSQNNVHPGRYLGVDDNGDVLYSDARALTLFELMRVMSLPDDWPLPNDTNEAFIRSVIGEGIPPMFIKKLFENLERHE